MATLLDIAPSTAVEAVRTSRGDRVVVRGLNANALASIASRYPKTVGIFLGGMSVGDLQTSQLISQFGAAVAPIIAAGCGELGNEEAERRADNLGLEDQLKLFKAIWTLTFPNGLEAFFKALGNLSSAAEGAKVHTIRRFKRSPSSSQPSSDEASPQTMQ